MILTIAMAHQRKLIRQAVVAILKGANTAAGARVHATRIEPSKKTELPAIAVYTLTEDSEETITAPIELTRELQLMVTAWVAHSDSYTADDAMDDIAEQIEAAMAADYYLSNTVVEQMLSATSVEVLDVGSDPLIGEITLTYAIKYRTSIGPVVAGDFDTVHAEHRIAGATQQNEAVDTFTVQES